MSLCAWCGAPFPPNLPGHGRPRLYCSTRCRTDHAHYREDLPGWQARLAELEAAAATYASARMVLPSFLRNELAGLRAAIAAGPVERSE